MKYHVLIGDHHHEVEVMSHRGQWRVTLDGETLEVDLCDLVDGRAYSMLLDDRSVDVGVEESGNNVALLIAGRRYTTEVLGEREWLARSIEQASGGGEKVVRAVMTGIVREVMVKPGDTVEAGQVVFILEAMKMENEVKCAVSGTVTSVTVEPGLTVELGQVVVEIE
ncbi:MAG: biotin carboxyl carrier protein [Pseudohongiellaceae bacterium]|jgi:biotin carboxyl carrier protein